MKNYFRLRTVLVVAALFVSGFAYSADTVHVWLKPIEGGKDYRTTIDAADGRFSFPEVLSGEYEIRLELKEHFHEGDEPPQLQFDIDVKKFGFGGGGNGSLRYVPEVKSPSKLKMSSGDAAGTYTGLLGKAWVWTDRKTTQLQGQMIFANP